jgi:WD40 repeat protein
MNSTRNGTEVKDTAKPKTTVAVVKDALVRIKYAESLMHSSVTASEALLFRRILILLAASLLLLVIGCAPSVQRPEVDEKRQEGEKIRCDCELALHTQGGPLFSMVFHPSGKFLAGGGSVGRLVVWEFPSGNLVHNSLLSSQVSACLFACGGQELIAACWGGELYSINLSTFHHRLLFRVRDGSELSRMSRSPDGRFAAFGACAPRRKVCVWRLADASLVWTGPGDELSTSLVLFLADGALLIGGLEGDLWKYDGETGRCLVHITKPEIGFDKGVESPKHDLVAVNDFGRGQVRLFEPRELKEVGVVRVGQHVCDLAFSPDGLSFVVCCGEAYNHPGDVICYDVPLFSERCRFAAHKGAVTALAFSPDGKWLATAGENSDVKVWRCSEVLKKP